MEDLTGVSVDKVLGKGNYQYALPFYGERRPMLVDMIIDPTSLLKNYFLILPGTQCQSL
jgi:hypothetical protein